MVFSTLIFLYLFLPFVLIGNFLLPQKWRNYFLLLCSFVFFASGGVSYSLILVFSVLNNYFFGRLIDKYLGTKKSKLFLAIGVSINLLLIVFFKYANFIIFNYNLLSDLFGVNTVEIGNIILPIGISFYTFQAISYLVDVYSLKSKVQKNLFHLALFIFLFPQLIAGPIIRYHDIAKQIISRKNNIINFVSGIKRFILGLAKKVLIANQMALIADKAFEIAPEHLSTPLAWMGILAYSLQIYFDFSGYSDMAIGLGRMLGFDFMENFNFPYIAKSIKEFWRRWHISLSTWFRDYLYFPLGGNRKGLKRTYINLIIVFFLTGLWHGSSWNFVFWGLFHGLFLVIERMGFDKILQKAWKPIQHFYTLLIVLISWVFFRADSFAHAYGYLQSMFSLKSFDINRDVIAEFDSFLYIGVAVIAILSSTTLWLKLGSAINNYMKKYSNSLFSTYKVTAYSVEILAVISVLFISTILLISNSYNPFIYFRF